MKSLSQKWKSTLDLIWPHVADTPISKEAQLYVLATVLRELGANADIQSLAVSFDPEKWTTPEQIPALKLQGLICVSPSKYGWNEAIKAYCKENDIVCEDPDRGASSTWNLENQYLFRLNGPRASKVRPGEKKPDVLIQEVLESTRALLQKQELEADAQKWPVAKRKSPRL